MHSLWNEKEGKWVEADSNFTIVKWDTIEFIEGKTANIQVAANGFIVECENGRWVELSVYGITSRLEELLQRKISHEKKFVATEHTRSQLTAAGYSFPSE